ncbi:hypothetical protein DdX_12015 [Ditylenchus destructor]|uniref:Uncharacterized protein n=1 Tax=Ditylenchus destructor TaxID=166010 RepID=A0AAD4R3T2_9BILA|nr:hypothetical protein DdX_12015 [Ditylenchus destructor]
MHNLDYHWAERDPVALTPDDMKYKETSDLCALIMITGCIIETIGMLCADEKYKLMAICGVIGMAMYGMVFYVHYCKFYARLGNPLIGAVLCSVFFIILAIRNIAYFGEIAFKGPADWEMTFGQLFFEPYNLNQSQPLKNAIATPTTPSRSTRRGTPHLLASLIVIVSVPFIAFQFFCLQVFYLDGRDHYRLWKSSNCHDLFCTHTNYQYCGGRAEASIPRTPGGGLNHRNDYEPKVNPNRSGKTLGHYGYEREPRQCPQSDIQLNGIPSAPPADNSLESEQLLTISLPSSSSQKKIAYVTPHVRSYLEQPD